MTGQEGLTVCHRRSFPAPLKPEGEVMTRMFVWVTWV